MAPRVRYTKAEDFSIAYQTVGDGPVDLVFSPGWVTHLDLAWDIPALARFYERLASFCRLILFDKRGIGLSDRVSPDHMPTLEQRSVDIRAVMEAVGSERAILFGTPGAERCAGSWPPPIPSASSGSSCTPPGSGPLTERASWHASRTRRMRRSREPA